jgi:hypothetical protein
LAGAVFFGADLPFCFAHRCFMASEIRLRGCRAHVSTGR